MANEHLQKYFRMTKEVRNLFDDLEEYLEFCKTQGYVYDEAHLYNEKTPWGEMTYLQYKWRYSASSRKCPCVYHSNIMCNSF